MCFSPEADLITGAVITAVGIDASRHVAHRAERPLAALPILFGVHQMTEAVVWWDIEGRVPEGLGPAFAWLYLAIAFGLVPWLVPWMVRRIEPDDGRRRAMAGLVGVGVVVAILLMSTIVRGPIHVVDGGNYLAYDVPLAMGGYVTALYILATCGSLLLASDRYVVSFGAINLAAVVGLAVLLSAGVISLWCVWAAVTSVVVALHFRRTDGQRHHLVARSAPA